jgi:hypothetical protein
MMQLNEGLKELDLQDLVLPLISVDEYESKIDEEAIVVAFFVQDNEPAQDLNRFIQKSAISLLDTDVSPAPNEDGYFLVFVEFFRERSFIAKLLEIIETLEGLTGYKVEQWKFKPYGYEEVFDVTEEKLDVMINVENIDFYGDLDDFAETGEEEDEEDEDDVTESRLAEFFRNSIMETFELHEGNLELGRMGRELTLRYVSHSSNASEAMHEQGLSESAIRMDPTARQGMHAIQFYLGEAYQVIPMQNVFVINPVGSEEVVIVKL